MPLDSSVQSKDETQPGGLFQAIVARLPDDVRATFTETQLESLKTAAETVKFGDHPVDIRLSLPTVLSRYYVVLLAGKERRSKERRALERARYPIARICNILFLLGLAGVGVYVVLFLEMLFFVSFFSDYFVS